MNIYIAAPWEHREFAKHVAELVNAEDRLTVKASWLDGKIENLGTDMDYDSEHLKSEAVKDVIDVSECQAFLLLNVQARGSETSGKAVETGIALALGKTIIIVGKATNIFHLLSHVTIVKTIDEAIIKLKSLKGV